MARTSKAISVGELGRNPARVVRRVRASKNPVEVRERGRTQLVLLSVETYERSKREREILLALARGEREMAAGRRFSFERVLGDADKVLACSRK
ncbi:MAG TPA: type II toxin-antitoxin system prevent-host-death family antitoxin [Myxococcota bacterium]|nr:type II toxin-antitoxin system prevent-host-death family antitoxin [Myxococcota bacterium]